LSQTRSAFARTASITISGALLVVGCGGSNPTGVPYSSLGYDLAGIYTPAEGSAKNVRLVLSTRYNLTGRYENAVGEDVRFYGDWERRPDGRLTLYMDGGVGLPGEVVLDVAQERVSTSVPVPPPGIGPAGPPQPPRIFFTDLRRLRGEVDIEGTLVELDLSSVIVTSGAAGGGQTAN
jgi:hypothetical protein